MAKDGSYFQAAKFAETTPKLDDFRLTLKRGGEELDLTPRDVKIQSLRGIDLKDAPVVVLPSNGAVPPIEGRVVAGAERRYGTESYLNLLQSRRPALILLMSRDRQAEAAAPWLEEADAATAPVIRIAQDDAFAALSGRRALTVSLHLAPPAREDVTLENVAGILHGSDPVLKDQYVLLTAHYDHLGTMSPAPGDRIYNGANDNASGTVSVIEIAAALASMQPHPKRSILFMAVFGEEKGLLGSYYYTRHPLVPLKSTVADINLEQMGRTDDTDGPKVGSFAFTGPAYSDLPAMMESAAKAEGVKVSKHADADSYFDRSDNYAFALAGIVAHTIAVAFEFPDYHAVGDEWRKIDYENMAKVDKAVAAGVAAVADAADAPHWSNAPDAAEYREAGK